MFRRWHTGHSLAAGVLAGLLLDHHVWTVAAVAFGLGLVLGRAWSFATDVALALRSKLHLAKRKTIRYREQRPPGHETIYDGIGEIPF